MATATEQLLQRPNIEAVFQAFVRNANAKARNIQPPADKTEQTRRELLENIEGIALERKSVPKERQTVVAPVVEVGSLPPKKTGSPAPSDSPPSADALELTNKKGERSSRPDGQGEMRLIPDVRAAQKKTRSRSVKERVEDGLMPPRELDQTLADMAALLRYEHTDEVSKTLDSLLAKYPRDLLLLRRVVEFHLETGSPEAAKDCLFRLAMQLFERRNFDGTRKALEQVMVLDPRNPRATKLLSLLDRR